MMNLYTRIILNTALLQQIVHSFTPKAPLASHLEIGFGRSKAAITTSTTSRIATQLSESSSAASSSSSSSLPTIEQLSSDPFMKQVNHAFQIVPLLDDNNNHQNDIEIQNLLQAQLSHSDGIRGFFVSYLTGDGKTAADNDDIPLPLMNALEQLTKGKSSSDNFDILSLSCMNLIMPTAMVTMHQDEILAKSSEITANRGSKIVEALLDTPGMKEQCEAIRYVASVGLDTITTTMTMDEDDKDFKV